MTLFPIEFYVPRDELDATEEIIYNSTNKHVMLEWKKNGNTRKPVTLHSRRHYIYEDLCSSCLNHNLLLRNNVFNYCAFSKLYLTFKYTILKL